MIELASQAEQLAWLALVIPTLAGTGIVYCLTVRDTQIVAGWLRTRGNHAVSYSGESDAAEREETEMRLLGNELKVVVATSALGMGFDKSDLAFVIHYQAPGSVISYYQQIGRAGRALDDAPVILLRGVEDEEIQDYFIETAFPRQEDAEDVMRLLDERGSPVPLNAILREVNVRRTRLEAMLKVLEAEGGVVQIGGGWQRTLSPWTYDADRVERVTAQRRAEQLAMRNYGTSSGCLMEYLQRQLDDASGHACGRCTMCSGWDPGVQLPPELIALALEFLYSRNLRLQPRRAWPPGLDKAHGRIPADELSEDGRLLCVHSDGGWGSLVKEGKFRQGQFADELVAASVELIRHRWDPAPRPEWATAIPSRTRPELVAGFVRRLAEALDIPFVPCLEKVRDIHPQKDMENSVQQARNVLGAFAVTGPVPSGPVLLVDDIVDSGWTLTVAGIALRRAGSGPVLPFALAKAAGK